MEYIISKFFYMQTMLVHPERIPRLAKKAIFFFLDVLPLPVLLWLAMGLRLGFSNVFPELSASGPFTRLGWLDLCLIIAGSAFIIFMSRLYRVRLSELDNHMFMRIAITGLALIVAVSTIAFLNRSPIPRSVGVIYGLSFMVWAGFIRILLVRLVQWQKNTLSSFIPVAIYGAGLAGIQLAASLKRSPEVKPIVFIDDNPALQGLIVSGIKVKSSDDLEEMAQSGLVQEVLIGTTSMSRSKRANLFEKMQQYDCKVKIIPSYIDLIAGRSVVSDLQPLFSDQLLERDVVDLDIPEIELAYADRVVMVTGAGGSIGSEICLQLSHCAPRKLVFIERSEHALYEIERKMAPICEANNIELFVSLASVVDPLAINAVISEQKVDIIFHAAAYKHVPLVENNEVDGARNNIIGTAVVAKAAAHHNIERFILISTDKAVRPTNIMGATKRMAELTIASMQKDFPDTRFSAVRFGNVLGSSGSVVPLFHAQIQAGGPITVTHEEVTRYFMTISEAARLVLLAGAFSSGGDLFILDMGQPVRIVELARRMVKLCGLKIRDAENPDGDIEIEITGLRPGEKLYEELLADTDNLTDTPHTKIFRAEFDGLSKEEFERMLTDAQKGIELRDADEIRITIGHYVPEYSV